MVQIEAQELVVLVLELFVVFAGLDLLLMLGELGQKADLIGRQLAAGRVGAAQLA